MGDDWLAEVRARYDPADTRTKAFNVYEDVRRLLECAEALAELVAVHDKPGRYPPSGDRGAAWQRARAALEGADG